MLMGIDVGGTFTDGVLYERGRILDMVKYPTLNDNLQESILQVIDKLLQDKHGADISRIVLSTTLVTNLLATGRGDQAALLLIPGPGLNLKALDFFPQAHILKGATDFRGRITQPLDMEEVKKVGQEIIAAGIGKVAVVGKFSPRNETQENQVEQILRRKFPHLEVFKGSDISGELNFLRRAVTTYYTAITMGAWSEFAGIIRAALHRRRIDAPIDILKADGGTMPLEVSLCQPCETIFSGPAASVMGAFALTMDNLTSVVIDIGGTTTDLALILNGKPLHASRGALIDGYYSTVRSFALRSLPLGGDSAVRWLNGQVTIGPDRLGPAACFGGPQATPTDAFNYLEQGQLGSLALSGQALQEVSRQSGLNTNDLAKTIVQEVTRQIRAAIGDMFKSWEQEPAYRIWEIIHRQKVRTDRIVGIGAAAQAFVPPLARSLQCQSLISHYSPVANALGAAVSRPTLSLLVHADTQKGAYYLNLDGIRGKCPPDFQLTDVKKLAYRHLQQIAKKRGIQRYAQHCEFFLEEQFNVVRGWSTRGKIYDVGIQIAPGVIADYKGVEK
jgi:N-methylhydantoinase A